MQLTVFLVSSRRWRDPFIRQLADRLPADVSQDQSVLIVTLSFNIEVMNSFGRIFKVTIFGESHGESVGLNIDGCPAGLPLSVEDFLPDIERRKGGTQKGTTPRK